MELCSFILYVVGFCMFSLVYRTSEWDYKLCVTGGGTTLYEYRTFPKGNYYEYIYIYLWILKKHHS